MKKTKDRILYIYLESTSFVRDDFENLGKHAELIPFEFGVSSRRKGWFLFRRSFAQFFWLLRNWSKAEMVFGWFVDYHMLLPVLFSILRKKPVLIFLGGFECFDIPSLNYGIFNSWWRAPIARFIFRRATLLLPVSEQLIHSHNAYTLAPENKEFGLLTHIPGLKTKIQPLPTGYDPEQWPLFPGERKRQVCTTGLIDSERTFRRKGLDVYIDTARKMPEIPFLIIGVSESMQQAIRNKWNPPANVVMRDKVARERLKDIYKDVAVYIQLSRIEGLPNVLCEAMLCGCIPVGSNVFGIPEAIGDTGYLVDIPDPDKVASMIKKALSDPVEKRKRARERIVTHFTKENRGKFLADLIDHPEKFF